jgi:hypothetical protein
MYDVFFLYFTVWGKLFHFYFSVFLPSAWYLGGSYYIFFGDIFFFGKGVWEGIVGANADRIALDCTQFWDWESGIGFWDFGMEWRNGILGYWDKRDWEINKATKRSDCRLFY